MKTLAQIFSNDGQCKLCFGIACYRLLFVLPVPDLLLTRASVNAALGMARHRLSVVSPCLSQIFSNDGQFKSRFGIRGRTPGQMQRPTGVAVHPNGDIIVADYDNKWVSIFSSEGKFKVSRAGMP